MNKITPLLILFLVMSFVGSLMIGQANASFGDSLSALFSGDGPLGRVMQDIRLPRAVLGMMVGVSLGLSGAAMQGYLRNPLAEPGIIGISGAASLGAVVSLQTGFAALFWLALPVSALGAALVAVLMILTLAGPRGGSLTLILAGIAVSALASALTSLALNLSPNPYATYEIVFWMMGSLADRSMDHVWVALPFCLIGWAMIASLGRALNALSLGEDTAASMGINLSRTRLVLIIGVAASVGAVTAGSGAIGFVGLIVPHILRNFVGARPSSLLYASALGGGVMVLIADIAVRLILPNGDLKLGVVMALIGAPLFLHLIYKTRGGLE
jgi:iron complex transport system permease protein